MRHQIEIIDLPSPYNDPCKVAQISAYTGALVRNELPAFQVEVGDDFALAGTFAVQAAIEEGVAVHADKRVSDSYPVPFRFSYQNLRAPFYVRPSHARITTLSPHVDGRQIGPAIHKEYVGEPTEVQFGYVSDMSVLPPVEDGYMGPGLAAFADTVYEGVTKLGRLSVFSQGNAYWDMQPTVHYFKRVAGQPVGGRYTRYSMLDPATCPYPGMQDYERFVTMRAEASLHLDWWQWQLLGEELEAKQTDVPALTSERYASLVKQHTAKHPGEDYHYWTVDSMLYGVFPRNSDNATPFFLA